MAFRDLGDFLVVEPVVLPIRGKEYSFPGEISARAWLRLQRLSELLQAAKQDGFVASDTAVDDEEEADLMGEMLGGVENQMMDDGCTSQEIKAVFYTLIAYHLSGVEAAEVVWNSAGETPAPNRAARRSKAPAKSTRSRGSHDGSTAPKKNPTATHGPTS